MKERPVENKEQEKRDGPVPDIPNLKKREKERKKAGAAWGGSPVRTPFAGATGGSGATGMEVAGGAAPSAAATAGAVAGAAGSGAAAPAGVGALASSSGWLGGANASFLGRAMIGVGLASVMAGVGLYAYLRLHVQPKLQGAALGPISDSIKVRRSPNDERLRFAAQAGHGQFKFDDTAAPPAAETAATEGKSQPQAQEPGPAPEKPAANPWGDILSAVQSGQPWGSDANSGGHDLFSALTGSGARGSRGASMPSLHYPGRKGNLSGLWARGASSSKASAMRTRNISSRRAFGQLRYARAMSVTAARGFSSEQDMRKTALQAFDQNDSQGGEIETVDSPVSANPSLSGGEYGGGTAALLSDPNALPAEPATVAGVNSDAMPYQAAEDAIQQLIKEAAMLKMISMLLIALGIALMAVGIALMCNPYTLAAGIAILAIGVMVLAMGIMMLMMAMQMGAQAQALSNALQTAMGQMYQTQNNDACIQQALANGTDTSACTVPNTSQNTGNQPTTVSQDVNAEQSSTWEYDDGQPAGSSQ